MRAIEDKQKLQKALSLHQKGNLKEAADLYRQLIRDNSNSFNALHYLGVIEAGAGNLEQAKHLMARSLAMQPNNVEFAENYATILYHAQDYSSALQICQSGLQLNRNSISLVYVSAISLFKLNKFEESLEQFDKLLLLQPRHLHALNEQGSVLAMMGQYDVALESVEKALAIDQRYAEAHLNKGNLCSKLKRYEEAIAAYDTALALRPRLADAWTGRGNVLRTLKRFDDAIAAHGMALELNPDLVDAWLGRGNVLYEISRHDEARAAYDRALALNPDCAEAWLGLGNVYLETNRNDDANAAYDQALSIKPDLADAWFGRGIVLTNAIRLTEALAAFDKVVAMEPDHSAANSNRIFLLDFVNDAGFKEQQKSRNEWWQNVGSVIAKRSPAQYSNSSDPNRRIKLGYVSADFHNHSAAFCFKPILSNHDKTQFEVICYSSSKVEDELSAEFRRTADRWRDVLTSTDDELCKQIQADQIDILVDLSGHSKGNRLGVFARKPAPVQVTGWGHATGTGLPTIDYLFSDPVACPQAVRHMFAEKVRDLPCVITIDALPDTVHLYDPPVLSKGRITFGVFNRASKISNNSISLWADILHAVPRSQILMKDGAFSEESARMRLVESFARCGVATERVSFFGRTPRRDHLTAFKDVDISLDPFPHGGGVSTWESLQMGVPVVAKLGTSISGRVSGAILTSIGMADWVSESTEDYLAIAVKFAAMPDLLKALRHELPSRILSTASGNNAIYTKAVEAAYLKMWTEYCLTASEKRSTV